MGTSPSEPIRKILVANRGEIAVRIMRTCRELGIATVAVYSDPDRHALHVRQADEAWPLPGAAPRDTYLDQEKILGAAKKAGAGAIHPGYGFLSENAAFSRACRERGIVFIGPGPESIEMMGEKTRARETMSRAGVPVVPGTPPLANEKEAETAARAIGYPVLIKAAGGGGGKGMRKVERPGELAGAFAACRREALSAFGDGRVYIEKFLSEPHHIEFQILADAEGGACHLFERECSVQRRHQKIIEETPSPLMTDALREAMGAAAVKAARACGYVSAGTIEFLVDAERRFYFLEMNTRLQVEHPITEMITGVDLVAKQIEIAGGGRPSRFCPRAARPRPRMPDLRRRPVERLHALAGARPEAGRARGAGGAGRYGGLRRIHDPDGIRSPDLEARRLGPGPPERPGQDAAGA